jgi:hypothetical protein
MSRETFDTELIKLQQNAEAQFVTYERGREDLWRLLARAYLWWRRAKDIPGYLDDLYEARGIRGYDIGSAQNFSPLIRLVWNFEGHVTEGNQASAAAGNNKSPASNNLPVESSPAGSARLLREAQGRAAA